MKKGIMSLSACLAIAGMLSACSSQSTAQPTTPPATASQSTSPAAQDSSSSSQASSSTSLSASDSQQAATAKSTEVKLDMNEFSYSMKEIKVHPGETIHFVLTNSGKVEHDINSEELNLDKDVEPGKTETFDWTAPAKTGTYPIICDKPGHKEKGMTLNLIVEN